MNRMLRLWLLTCIGAVGLLTSCSNSPAIGDDSLEVWHAFTPEETIVFQEIVNDYRKAYLEETGESLNVTVKYVSYGDMFTKLRTAALGNMTPDVAFVDAIKVTDLAFGQALTNLTTLNGFREKYGDISSARAEFVSASFDAGLVNRLGEVNLYALPVQTTTVSLFWNREMFRLHADSLRNAGLDPNRAPRDWDELIAYGRILTNAEQGVYGFGMSGSLWFNFPIYNMYDVQFVEYDEVGRAHARFDSPNGKAALERLLTLADSGVEGGAWRRSALSPDAGFINRRYAMILTGPWQVEAFSNAGLDFDISLIPAPPQSEIDRLGLQPKSPKDVERLGIQAWSSSNVGGQSGVIMRSSENKEAAFAFIDYFTSESVQRRWASSLGQIPVRRSAWVDLDTSKFPFMTKFMDQLKMSLRIPQIPLYGILESNIYNPEIDLLLQGRQPPDSMLQKMDAQTQSVIFDKINEAISADGD